jgi:hypothetical protein
MPQVVGPAKFKPPRRFALTWTAAERTGVILTAVPGAFSGIGHAPNKPTVYMTTVVAHKRALLIYTLLTQGEDYTDPGRDDFEQRCRERVTRQKTHCQSFTWKELLKRGRESGRYGKQRIEELGAS